MEEKRVIVDAVKKTGKPMKVAEIAEASGLDKKEIDKSVKELIAEGKMYSPKRCFYDVK